MLIDADLSGADSEKHDKAQRTIVLRGRDLRNAVSDRADLRKGDDGAQLGGASLVRTRLSSANLADADLAKAKLEYTELQNAHLERTRLNGVKSRPRATAGCESHRRAAAGRGFHFSGSSMAPFSIQYSHRGRQTPNFAALKGAQHFVYLQGAELGLSAPRRREVQRSEVRRRGSQTDAFGGREPRSQAQLQGADLHSAALKGAQLVLGANRGGRYLSF